MEEEATLAKVRPNDGLGVCHPERSNRHLLTPEMIAAEDAAGGVVAAGALATERASACGLTECRAKPMCKRCAQQSAELNEHDAVILRNTRRRVNRARNFPDNTCAASRHLHLMAEQLASAKPYPMLQEEPQHCAITMLSVLESLWKARTELANLKTPNAELRGRQGLHGPAD